MKRIIYTAILLSALILSCSSKKEVSKDEIVVSLGGEVATIDPHLNTASAGTVYIRHFFEGLMKKDKDGKLTGGIAENYSMSEDGLSYLFYLRTNAKWSDGQPVTAQMFINQAHDAQNAIDDILS